MGLYRNQGQWLFYEKKKTLFGFEILTIVIMKSEVFFEGAGVA
jgi:hypothetical protein